MYNFTQGQWYQRDNEIVYVYDIDNLDEYVWLMPAIYPQPYDIGKSQPNISQYEYFKDMHEYERIMPPCFEIDDVVVYIGPDVTFKGITVLKNNSLVQIVNKHDESYGDHYSVIMPEIALSVRVTPYEIKKNQLLVDFFFFTSF